VVNFLDVFSGSEGDRWYIYSWFECELEFSKSRMKTIYKGSDVVSIIDP
jgi:hypothetical protein